MKEEDEKNSSHCDLKVFKSALSVSAFLCSSENGRTICLKKICRFFSHLINERKMKKTMDEIIKKKE